MVSRIEYCAVCNEEIKPGQPAEFGAPRENEWTGVHLECPCGEVAELTEDREQRELAALTVAPLDETTSLRDLLREALDGWELAQAGLHAEFCTSSDHRGRACEPRIDEIRQAADLTVPSPDRTQP